MERWQDEQLIEVEAAPDAVYRYLADFGSLVDWTADVVDVERPAAGFVVGAAFTTAGRDAGAHRQLRITALQPPMRIAWESRGAGGIEEWEFLLLPAARGRTSLARRVSFARGGKVSWWLRGRKRAERLAEENRAGLERVKRAIEATVGLEP
jgi:hypothetical protein